MKLIPLSTKRKNSPHYGKHFAMVDDEEYDFLMQWKWNVYKNNGILYVARCIQKGGWERFLMHRVILGLEKGDKRIVDHKDHNGFNNQKSNIRICTTAQNGANKIVPKTPNSQTKYRGVYIHKRKYFKKESQEYSYYEDLFRARIHVVGKQICLGFYRDEISAAKAYNAGAIKYHGEFAILNDV